MTRALPGRRAAATLGRPIPSKRNQRMNEHASPAAGAPQVAHVSTAIAYPPERNPFQSVFVDVTHRCNMACRNGYLPNRDIPDMDLDWLSGILARLPRRTHIRIIGAEPTLRRDLPELVRRVRELGHLPILLTNGLKLANRRYLGSLKRAGLRTVYLSFNGGFDDAAYEAMDDLRCAARKARALDNLCAENMYVSLGVIVARGINEGQLPAILGAARQRRQVHEVHLRSVGPYGHHLPGEPYTLDEMRDLAADACGVERAWMRAQPRGANWAEARVGRVRIAVTRWPDLGSKRRGRLAPDGTIQPFFEHMIANQGGY